MTTDNPLLDFSNLPRFSDVRPGHVSPAISELLHRALQAVEAVATDEGPAGWASVVAPMEEPLEQLGRAWNIAGHLQAVVDTPELRAAYNENLPKVSDFYTRLGADLRLFARYKALAATAEFAGLPPARRRMVNNALRDFRLGGAELTGAPRERYAQVSARLANLSQKFSENVLDVTNAWTHFVDDEQALKGIPADAIAAARHAAETDGKPGYKLTLQMPSYLPVMQYADDRALREALYKAYVTRASDLGDAGFDNSALMLETLALRTEQAALLGFNNFAEYSMVPKMAETPAEVISFVRTMTGRAKPFAMRDMQELRDFARAALGMNDVQAWDVPYVSEKLRQARYSYSDTEVKRYFSEPRVMAGLFELIQTLFNVQLAPAQAPLWHADARFYTITRDGRALAHLYVDSYARTGKRGGAWMDVARPRRLKAGQLQTPVAYVTCNFGAPVGNRPTLLSHDEVTTLFHEFGHALHHVLTQVDEPSVDMRAVEWDAIELPSQFMENFCWEWDVVSRMSGHVDTGEPLPRALFDKMLAARNFQSGLFAVRQMEFSLLDMLLHTEFDAGKAAAGGPGIGQVLQAVRDEVSVVPVPPYNRMAHAFSHIFSGGYAAGYYSYKWAEVMSADAYSLFEEKGALDPQTGALFLKEILEVGGTRPAKESFRAFRGRDPQVDALLRHSGMTESA